MANNYRRLEEKRGEELDKLSSTDMADGETSMHLDYEADYNRITRAMQSRAAIFIQQMKGTLAGLH